MDLELAKQRLREVSVPPGVMYVIETLQAKGHQAVLVGGCVRDCVLERRVKDWDMATSAVPQEVQRIFKKTIPTGIEHGTVTVLPPKGPKGEKTPVEVTTFRGDEGYADGRHPDQVRFLTDLDEDLARRDFTINAMAYDPVAHRYFDPFHGVEDLGARKVRAVGEAKLRFEEDGLRTMRALRFAATLGFQLEADTAQALGLCAQGLAKVSRERVRVELEKMLQAKRPGESLEVMWESGIWEIVLGQGSRPADREALLELLQRVDGLSAQPWHLRLAGLLWDVRSDKKALSQVIEGLRPSRQDKRVLGILLGEACSRLREGDLDAWGMRRVFVAVTPEFCPGAMELAGWGQAQRARFEEAVKDCPSGVAQLEISAKDLMQAEICVAGPALGECLRGLLDWVLEEPSRNRRADLLERARAIVG